MEAFEKLAKNNGLDIEIIDNVHRAWFNDKDFIMSINTRREYQYLEIASKVLGRKFMLFKQYTDIDQRTYTKLDKQIKQLIGDFKVAQVEERLEIMGNDFK
jgi:frataxin-like iron-binding protein CyaY